MRSPASTSADRAAGIDGRRRIGDGRAALSLSTALEAPWACRREHGAQRRIEAVGDEDRGSRRTMTERAALVNNAGRHTDGLLFGRWSVGGERRGGGSGARSAPATSPARLPRARAAVRDGFRRYPGLRRRSTGVPTPSAPWPPPGAPSSAAAAPCGPSPVRASCGWVVLGSLRLQTGTFDGSSCQGRTSRDDPAGGGVLSRMQRAGVHQRTNYTMDPRHRRPRAPTSLGIFKAP